MNTGATTTSGLNALFAVNDAVYSGGGYQLSNQGNPINNSSVIKTSDSSIGYWQPQPDDIIRTIFVSTDKVYLGGRFKNILSRYQPYFASTDAYISSVGDPAIAPKIFLQGSYIANTGLMTDDLRSRGIIPTTSPYTDTTTCNASVFNLGGTSATGLAKDDIVDWVWVELRDKNDNTIILKSKSALLQRDGDVVNVDGTSALSFNIAGGDYYFMIRHRNHLGILSANLVSIYSIATSIDFTTNSSLVVGGTNGISTTGNGKFALSAGDFNGDGQVQNADKNSVEPLRGISGYSNADIDMNSEVQNAEINSVLNPNIGKGKQFP